MRGAPDLRGLVLSLYGTGNGPSHKDTFLQTIRDATSRGIVVVAVSQCPKGSVSLGTYEVGRHGQSGRLGEATAGHHGLHRLHLKAWGCPPHS